MSSLLGPREVRELAAPLGLNPRKSLGQNFVVDPNTIRRIVRLAELPAGAAVLEVGPGLGSLTLGLLEAGHQVTAVEIDPRLADLLPSTVAARLPEASDRLNVITADALAVSSEWGRPEALVANLPYNVAVPVLLNCLAGLPSLRRALVMVQSEVADRLAAPPGSRTYGVPSVKAAWYGHVRRVGSVPPTVFWPVPRVDSGLVLLTAYDDPAARHGTVARDQVFAPLGVGSFGRRGLFFQPTGGEEAFGFGALDLQHRLGLGQALRRLGHALGVGGRGLVAHRCEDDLLQRVRAGLVRHGPVL